MKIQAKYNNSITLLPYPIKVYEPPKQKWLVQDERTIQYNLTIGLKGSPFQKKEIS